MYVLKVHICIICDVSSIPANGIFRTKKQKNKKTNAQRVEND